MDEDGFRSLLIRVLFTYNARVGMLRNATGNENRHIKIGVTTELKSIPEVSPGSYQSNIIFVCPCTQNIFPTADHAPTFQLGTGLD